MPKLKISRAAVWSHIESLRDAGFEIIASPHLGYQLISSPEQLIAEDLQSRLAGKTLIGRRIQTLQTTSSTNDEIEKAAQAGEAEGLVVFAESKTRDEADWDANGLPQPGVVFGFRFCCALPSPPTNALS